MRLIPPIAFITVFSLGTLAVVGHVLADSNGLAELHKTVLVGFLVAFPMLALLIFVSLLPKGDSIEAAPFRSRNADVTPEPLGLAPGNRI
jgi:hypothetical protein